MFRNEEEAARCWCPFARVEKGNRIYEDHEDLDRCATIIPAGCECISIECMAWRWHDERDGLGYCALIGKPGPRA
jgi:hypothetical protein